MADRLQTYGDWLIRNKDKKGTPEFEKVAAAYRQLRSQGVEESEDEKRGIYPGLARGTRQFFSDIQTSVGSIFGGEEAALAGIKRGEEIARERGTGASLEELKRQYEREGALGAAGEVARSIPEEIAAQAPQIAATIASGAAGSAAGAALGGPAAPITSVIGGAIGALTPSYLQAYAANIERQAQEDIAAGREVDVSRAAAAATAVPQAALDLASQFLVVGRIVGRRVFGEATEEVYNLLRKGDRARAERVAREGLTKTIAKGTAVGVAAEVPTEVVQSALERAQAGLSITSDDAFKEYGEAAYKAGLASPLGAVGRYSERSAARREVAAAEPDLTQETEQERIDAEKEREREAAPPPPPAPSSLDEAPPELRTKLRELDSPKKAAEELRDSEMRLASLSEFLADAESIEETARKVGEDPIEAEELLMARADYLKNAIPFIRLRLQELSGTPIGETPAPSGPVAPIPQSSAAQQQLIEPPVAPPEGAAPAVSVTPTTPVPTIPQTAAAQQTLQIDQTVAEGLGLPGAKVAPKTQPFTVTTTTAAPPVAPISQEATAQQNLGMETTEFVDPVYLQAVDTVVKTGKPTIPALQKALGIGFNRAAKLLEQMEVEGVVTPKDKKTGKRKITMGQTQEAPSVTTEAAPGVAEQTQFESVGRGVAVPPQGLEPAGRVAEVTPSEGLGVAPRVAPDAAIGEGRVEPALAEPAPALPSTPEITETETAPKRRDVEPAAPTELAESQEVVAKQADEVLESAQERPAHTLSESEQELVDSKLTETQKSVIASEFGQDSYNDVAKKNFIEEVIKGANKGIQAVRARLRGIVRAVLSALLATGAVFNNTAFMDLNAKPLLVASGSTFRTPEIVRPTPPEEAAQTMSPAARATYERFMLDNKGLPFIIADKPSGQIFLFKADGTLIKFFSALYGKTTGDVLPRPIGQQLTAKQISEIAENERITPAGEYTAVLKPAKDYGLALFFQDRQGNTGTIAIHQVYTGNIKERRLDRLESADVTDNKVSYGCINVGLDNWNNYIVPNYGKGARVGVVPDEQTALDQYIPPPETTVQYTAQAAAPKRRGVVPAAPVMPRRDVEAAAADVVRGWTNAPEVVVLNDENDTRVPKGVKIDPSDKGFYHEGKTYVIASRASDTADVHATVYHESLGHFGIRQRFRSRLNEMLNDIYNTNPAVRAAADAIKTTGMSNAQAVEEVLAAKSEAGPIKEAGIRAAFNRVAAFIRRIGRAMGIRFAYSNNDVTQIIRLSQEKVIKGRREVAGVRSVAEAKKIERDLLNISVKKLFATGQKIDPFKILTPENAELTLAFVEGMSDKLRPFFLALRSMDEMVDIFGQKVPALKGIVKIVKRRATKLRELREEIGNNINRWNSVLSDKQYQGAIINKFYSVAIESTERQVDFRRTIKLKNGTVVPNKAYNSLDPLTNKFESLPEPLKKVYFEMLEAYREMSNRYLDLITKNLPPTAANILRKEIESRRLKIYLPLYREGDYWIRYQDPVNNETVVEAYQSRLARLQGIRELQKAGIRIEDIQQYSKIEKAVESPGMGTFGFFGKVNEELDKYYKQRFGKKAKIPPELKQTLYKLFLDTIPASSVRQQFRKREGYKGAEKDMLRVYATVASRMANQLTNLEFSPEIDEAAKLVREDVAKDETIATQQVESEINKRLNFLRDPTNNYWVNKAVFLTYFDFIMGNISSAAANTTNLPMVVYPLLGAEYGYSRASEVMQDSIAMFMQGGWDRGGDPNAPRKFPSADRTMFDPAKIPPNSPLGRLFIEAVKQGAIKHSVGYDIMQARDREAKLNDYMGMWNDTKQFLGWTFQNTERFNREVALVSAFRLEMEKAREQGRTGRAVENAAIDKAIRLANEANGETLTELSPRVFQTGPLKVVLTFKRFARAMYALQLKLLRDALVGSKTDTTGMNPQDKAEAEAADRQFRQVAIKQWLGTWGGAFTFAGISGLPFYGLASSLGAIASAISAAMFGEADDEIEDKEEDLKQAMGVWAYKGPVNQIFGIDLASRTGFTGMFWRDDPRRIDEIGLEYFAIEQFLGPAWASARSRFDAIRDFQAGHLDRAIEKAIPVFLRNIAKTIRYGMEGAQTKDGKPIVDDLNAYQLTMQAFGFAPTEISEASARAGARKEIVKKVTDRRQALFESAYAAWSQGDQEGYIEALRDISKWNKTKTAAEFKATIDWDELEQSFRGRSRAAEEALDGVSIPKRYREGAVSRVPN